MIRALSFGEVPLSDSLCPSLGGVRGTRLDVFLPAPWVWRAEWEVPEQCCHLPRVWVGTAINLPWRQNPPRAGSAQPFSSTSHSWVLFQRWMRVCFQTSLMITHKSFIPWACPPALREHTAWAICSLVLGLQGDLAVRKSGAAFLGKLLTRLSTTCHRSVGKGGGFQKPIW